ncbi:hypothetical protein FXO38_12890 [Capsicum annuum]|nr:hypothetical protein FXO38_12890 [Capsicum annuum]
MTKQSYRFGWFSTKLKLVGGDSVVVVTTFYICSEVEARPLRDEIDFEFLGNRTGQSYLIQTNVYNGCGGQAALDAVQKLIAHGYLRGEASPLGLQMRSFYRN